MKIALLTDTHFGARGDNSALDKYFAKFYNEVFFPYIDKHEIKQIIHLGDIFDRRKYINFQTLESCKKYFFNEIGKRDLKLDIIVGNHDIFYKNTNDVNSPNLLLQSYKNIETISEPQIRQYGSCDVLMLPWIVYNNYEKSMDLVRNGKASVCFGHLQLAGFVMHKGHSAEDGYDPNEFKKFDLCCSGHYHHKSNQGNIHYLGSTYEMTWSDYEDPRGYHIFDTETRTIDYKQNPFNIFHKVYYDDQNKIFEELVNQYFEYLENCYVKVIVKNKNNPYWFDKFIDRLEKVNPINIQVVDDHLNLDLESEDDIVNEAESTLTILNNYIDTLEVKADKQQIRTTIKQLYDQALSL